MFEFTVSIFLFLSRLYINTGVRVKGNSSMLFLEAGQCSKEQLVSGVYLCKCVCESVLLLNMVQV